MKPSRIIFGVSIAILSFLAMSDDVRVDRGSPAPSPKKAEHSFVAATLDTPLPAKGSAIWCASFELAWHKLRELDDGAPIDLDGADDISRRLNRTMPAKDLDATAHLAMAGAVNDGIVEVIRREMKTRFPMATMPPFDAGPGAEYVAFAYLKTTIDFPAPYAEGDSDFIAADGTKTHVRGFGVWSGLDGPKAWDARRQLRVLFHETVGDRLSFALDLQEGSKPYQIVAARIARPMSLLEAVDMVQSRGKSWADDPGIDKWLRQTTLDQEDSFFMPSMDWSVSHDFDDLTARTIRGGKLGGGHLTRAIQGIDFRLNKDGVVLESRAQIEAKSLERKTPPRYFVFNRPYLIYMIERNASRPFFAMWVEDAKMLMAK